MSSHSKLKKSRDRWREKAVSRANEVRALRKELGRVKKDRARFKQEAKEAQAHLKQAEETVGIPSVCSKADLTLLALELFGVARIGFRAVSRVLAVVGHCLGIAKAPCAQTIINWVIGLSITRMEYTGSQRGSRLDADPFSNGCIWLIDTSIALGREKILCVLALRATHHDLQESAPTLHDVSCIAVGVAGSWTGENIASFLLKVIHVTGRPAAFLKDGGTDLAKAVRRVGEQGFASPAIEDVSHGVANLLKHEYGDHPLFTTFLSACGKASGKLKQTVLACLAPPKVSTQARFMNLHRLVVWAQRLLEHSPPGRVANGSLIARLRASMGQLPACKAFIQRFLRDSVPLLQCQELLKNRGLSRKTVKQCEAVIEVIPSSSPVRIGFSEWMTRQLDIAEQLGLSDKGLPISSDPIESLFGVVKQHGAGPIKDAHRMALRLPSLCGRVTEQEVQRVLTLTVAQRQQIMGTFCSLTKQRRDILPNPGCLAHLTLDNADTTFEWIPGAENRSKNPVVSTVSDIYTQRSGPFIPLETQDLSLNMPTPSGIAMAG